MNRKQLITNRKKRKLNSKVLPIIFSTFLILILSICFIANKKDNIIYNSINKNIVLDGTETELDNWEISTVFYDSTVNNGKTPLTEIDWDASNLAYNQIETRVIKIQINYKNTNTVTNYAPGTLEISIPNLTYNSDQVYVTKNFGVNDPNHSGYDWNLKSQATSEMLVFTNANSIEKLTNVEGSIKLEYTITSIKEVAYITYNEDNISTLIEEAENECTHSFSKKIIARINNDVESDEISFSYTRTYTHPWEEFPYEITKTAEKIKSYDRLGENPQNYTWVKYKFEWNHFPYTINNRINYYKALYPYLYVPGDSFIVEDDEIPEGCVVYDSNGNLLEPVSGKYHLKLESESYGNSSYVYAYVGYPKDTYNTANNNTIVHNHVTLKGKYYSENTISDLAEAESSINLTNFNFSYTGDLYSIEKTSSSRLTYEQIVHMDTDLKDEMSYSINAKALYTGEKYDVIIGDDVLYITDENNEFRRLEDNEYSYNQISFSVMRNTNNQYLDFNKNNAELWVRYAGQTDYEFYTKLDNSTSNSYNVKNKNVVAFYVKIEDLEEGLNTSNLIGRINLNNADINRTHENNGTIYNFSYFKVLINDVLVNPGTESNYSSGALELLRDYDLEKHGTLLQRSVASNTYKPLSLSRHINFVSVEKKMPQPIQNDEIKKFEGQASLEIMVGGNTKDGDDNCSSSTFYIGKKCFIKYYLNSETDPNTIEGWTMYDLLPRGMKLESTEEEIKNSIEQIWRTKGSSKPNYIYSYKVNDFISIEDFFQDIKERTNVTIINNYKGYDRTLIKIEIALNNRYFIGNAENIPHLAKYTYNYSISYDTYEEFGSVWNNNAYVEYINHIADKSAYSAAQKVGFINNIYHYYNDNGSFDPEEVDINNNNSTTELLGYSNSSLTISSVISTHQDVQTSVQSEISNYDTGKVNVTKNGDYTYKLRVRTGSADVTNLIIYDSLEDYAKNPQLEIVKASGGKHYWQGEFLGVDTSYAESKGYQVKVYYNENPKPGTLAEDTTWQEYTDSTDKSKVKTLAFKFLNADGTPAVLSANTSIYVLLNMKSPNADYKTFSYNGCWTEWNAIDPVTERPVDFITGINSNIVKVALPSSVEPEEMTIDLEKEWNDNSNVLGIRPDSATFKVIANNDYASVVEVPITGTGNIWTTSVEVPKYDDDGEEIEYTIDEDTISLNDNYKYIPNVDNYKIVNTLYREVTLTKIWKDNTNAYLSRPTSITFNVLQNGNNYKSVTFGGELTTNEWTETITVPVFAEDGTEYVYSIEELSVDDYKTTCEEFTCTNTLTDDDTIIIKKVWQDNNNEYDTRPDNINIHLKQNDQNYQTIQLEGDSDTWESNEITVPMYDNEGVKYTYTIEETPLEEYGLVTYDQADYKVTNTLKKNISITITKKWIDDNNALDLRPNELKINLLRNNEDYQEITLSGASDTWTDTIEVPKYDENQKEYTYSIKELMDDLNEDYSDITYVQEELSVTNKLKSKINITITKVWDDNDNELLTRPESLNINLLRNGELLEELEIVPENISDNIWSIEVEDLDVYDNKGAKYSYTIEENINEQLERYETISYDQTNYTITNKLTVPPKVTLYFTVKNGYTLPGLDEIMYDDKGYNDVLERYNLNGEEEYVFHFELENVDTGEIIEGRLSTQGTLEFDDVPYGTYRAREGEDKYFSFVSMLEIEEVLGVTFKPDSMGGTITIVPTGKDIIYGANIINKITTPVKNPETKSGKKAVIISIMLLLLVSIIGTKLYKEYKFLKA